MHEPHVKSAAATSAASAVIGVHRSTILRSSTARRLGDRCLTTRFASPIPAVYSCSLTLTPAVSMCLITARAHSTLIRQLTPPFVGWIAFRVHLLLQIGIEVLGHRAPTKQRGTGLERDHCD